jgi:hypothetical protein
LNAVSDFDFEVWAALAREDPVEFERRRRAAIDALIASIPANRRRLEGIQFRVDMERQLARTPLKACLRMSAMMWEAFLDLRTELAGLGSGAVIATPSRARLELVKTNQPVAAAAPDIAATGSATTLPPPSAVVLTFIPRDADEKNE